MAALSGVTAMAKNLTTKNTSKLAAGGLGLGTLVTAGFCLFDFAKVPDAFNLKYNDKREAVEGLNWESGLKEIGKSIPKCAQMLIIPAVITAVAAGSAPIVATAAAIAAFAAPMGGYALLDKIFPHEDEKIEQIFKAKGIDISKSAGKYDVQQKNLSVKNFLF